MKIYLKSNWSEQFNYGDKTPWFFAWRSQEIKNIKSIIQHNDSSAILVSSVRWVWKTSFVHKSLSEFKDNSKYIPVFVNIGHTLSIWKDIDKKKQILVSLIRATKFNKNFNKDKDIKKLYEISYGKYKIEKSNSDEKNDQKEIWITFEIKENLKYIIPFIWAILTWYWIAVDNIWIRTFFWFLWLATVFWFFSWKTSWTKNIFKSESLLIDDSTDLLEIEFENWLKKQTNKKIIFVIDELDKVEEDKSFKIIKEYKNLFTRSFAHFIFICSQNAYDLVVNDREKSIEDWWIFPTFFTHIFYLSLPNSLEIKQYIDQIIDNKTDLDEKNKKKLYSYLLFRSWNDFFNLKRLIWDLIEFDEKDQIIIDIDKIRKTDLNYNEISLLYDWVNEYFLSKYLHSLKKYWKDNSNLQKCIFDFLNEYFNYNFTHNEVVINNSNIEKLVNFLIDIWLIDKNDIWWNFDYSWTNNYKRKIDAPLLDEDKEFNIVFEKMINLANDLDDIKDKYIDDSFKKYDEVYENEDWRNLTWIDLYTIYRNYLSVYNKLKNKNERVKISIDLIKEANKIIQEQIGNIYLKSFAIINNIINSHILNWINDLFLNQVLNNRPQILSSCNNLHQIFNSIPHKIYWKSDNTKSVILLKDFTDFNSIQSWLEALNMQKNILVINYIYSENKNSLEYPTIETEYKDKIWRKRRKKINVDNFQNIYFDDFRNLTLSFRTIKSHLED